jgi:predicted phage-related endonuclease
MSTVDVVSKIEELKELEALIREAEKEAEALKDEIKAEMTKRNTEELEAGRYVVRWTSVTTDRFDSKAFKAEMADVYGRYVRTTESRRFSIVG